MTAIISMEMGIHSRRNVPGRCFHVEILQSDLLFDKTGICNFGVMPMITDQSKLTFVSRGVPSNDIRPLAPVTRVDDSNWFSSDFSTVVAAQWKFYTRAVFRSLYGQFLWTESLTFNDSVMKKYFLFTEFDIL